jgi:hypothetical protein
MNPSQTARLPIFVAGWGRRFETRRFWPDEDKGSRWGTHLLTPAGGAATSIFSEKLFLLPP